MVNWMCDCIGKRVTIKQLGNLYRGAISAEKSDVINRAAFETFISEPLAEYEGMNSPFL